MTHRQSGLTLAELMIALAIIAVAFLALAMTQVNHLRASSRSAVATQVKTSANHVLEAVSGDVLRAFNVDPTSSLDDQVDTLSGKHLSFKFIDYYGLCAPSANHDGLRTSFRTQVASPVPPTTATSQAGFESGDILECTGSTTDGPVAVGWSVGPPTSVTPYDSEGTLDVTVTATSQNITLTVGTAISCYDVYPSPKKATPKPCPVPAGPTP